MKWELKRFNELETDEIYEILKLRSEVFVVEQQCIYQDCDGKDTSSFHLYASENDRIIAYLRILDKGLSFDEISIGRVVVDKDYRKRGLGRELMIKAMDFVFKNLKEEIVRISAQEYLEKFYTSLGFEVVSEIYLEDDIPHVEMLCRGNL